MMVVMRTGLAVLVVLALGVGPVEAGDVKIVVNGAAPFAPQRATTVPGSRVVARRDRRRPGSGCWVPQSYTYSVWVDGQYLAEEVWVAGHWEPRTYSWDYYQPYWIPESSTEC